MASSTRVSMRLLSPRIRFLQRKPAPSCTHIRHASSRYSSPSKRTFTAAPTQAPTFLDGGGGAAASAASAPAGIASSAIGNTYTLDQAGDTPLDARARALASEAKRQYHLRRMRFAGMGLLISIVGLSALLYNLDLDEMDKKPQQHTPSRGGQRLDASDEASARFQGKEVHVIGAGDGKRIVAQGAGEEIELVETGTSSVPHFPRTIYLPASADASSSSPSAASISPGAIVDASAPNAGPNPGNVENQEQYTLVGLGIRTVSFLAIQVYVAGLYIRTRDISALQERLIHAINDSASTLIPAEKQALRERLLDPAASREIWDQLLREHAGLKTAWRIAPTRNTDFSHLRDGWVTGITNRTREARQLLSASAVAATAGARETEFDAEDFGAAVGDFKKIFAGGKAPKGSVMVLARGERGTLDVWFQAKPAANGREKEMQLLGSVADERISRLIWLGYLGGAKVSSEAARQGVVEGCVAFAGRPVGSVETMVN